MIIAVFQWLKLMFVAIVQVYCIKFCALYVTIILLLYTLIFIHCIYTTVFTLAYA